MYFVVGLIGMVTFVVGLVLLSQPKSVARKWSALTIVAGFLITSLGGSLMPEEERLKLEQESAQRAVEKEQRAAEKEQAALAESRKPDEAKEAVMAAFKTNGLPLPESIEISSGDRMVATFQIDETALALIALAGIKSPREFASKAVILVRNAELPFDLVDSYRVTMNGPPPGPGLIQRYGSARFSEGSSVSWEPGLGK